jgi:uncharacterized protein YdhG (YjbR/CyaY superfamily)
MKKAKAARGASAKRAKPRTVAEYVAGISGPALTRFKELRAAVLSVAPYGATEIISYGIPALRRKRLLVWFAAFSDHCSLFPTAEVMTQFKDELKRFSTSKGTIHFPLDKRIPATIVKKLVKARVARESD